MTMCQPKGRGRHLAVSLAVALAWLAPAAAAPASPDAYRQLLRSTGWVVVPTAGKVSTGTCFVADRRRRLVITCRHVVGDAAEAVVYFPAFDKGKVIVEADYYLHHVAALAGRVVARDGARDLAVIRLDALPDDLQELPLAAENPDPGEDVHLVGNSGLADGGLLWRYTHGEVRLTYQKKVKTSEGVRKVGVVETQAPVNRGDSGGAVVNDRGQLVGVAASYSAGERLVSANTDAHEVKTFLAEVLAAKDGAAGPKAKPSDQPPSLVGHWKVSVSNKPGESGAGQFKADQTFAFSPSPGSKAAQPPGGHYAYANGVLWLMSGAKAVTVPVTWIDQDHFTFKFGESEFAFARQGP
jgi:S1-C subfamily serine protease